MLLELGKRLASRGPEKPTTVKLIFTASEEERTLGAWHYARSLEPHGPVAVVNLELAGGSAGFAYVPLESFVLRRFEPPSGLVQLLDQAGKDRFGKPVRPAPIPAFSYTDARSFLAHGIPAVTLMAEFQTGFPRGLHSPSDTRDRVSEEALERTVGLLEEVLKRVDANPGLLAELPPGRRPGSAKLR